MKKTLVTLLALSLAVSSLTCTAFAYEPAADDDEVGYEVDEDEAGPEDVLDESILP